MRWRSYAAVERRNYRTHSSRAKRYYYSCVRTVIYCREVLRFREPRRFWLIIFNLFFPFLIFSARRRGGTRRKTETARINAAYSGSYTYRVSRGAECFRSRADSSVRLIHIKTILFLKRCTTRYYGPKKKKIRFRFVQNPTLRHNLLNLRVRIRYNWQGHTRRYATRLCLAKKTRSHTRRPCAVFSRFFTRYRSEKIRFFFYHFFASTLTLAISMYKNIYIDVVVARRTFFSIFFFFLISNVTPAGINSSWSAKGTFG